MAQSGYTPLLIYGSSTAAAEPTAGNLTSSSNGAELALNYADGKLFYKNSGGSVRLLAVGYGASTVTPTAGGVQYGTGSALAFTAAGTAGQILQSNGSSAPTWVAAPSTSPGGSNTQVQYNNNGVFGGSADLTWDGSTLATTGLTASGAVTLSATSQNIALGTSQVGGTWTAGGASQTGAITLDQSTKTHTLNIGTGATENALTKTINLGTAGVSGSTTAINIGSAVSGATTNVTLNGTVQPGVVISGSSSGDALRITQTGAGNALLVEDAANPDSSPFVVDASGNVGIGTTSPAQALHVVSTGNQIKYPLRLQNDGTSGSTLGVGVQLNVYNGTSVANLGAIIGTGSTWSYGTYSANQVSISTGGSGGIRVATASAPITFHTGNADSDLSTERMRINAGAPILCLSGGNTSATGTGIAFPATQSASSDANTLDDYEEGTWTPSIGGTATYSARTGTYRKIGSQVTCWFDVTINAVGTGSGALQGLPFANNASAAGGGNVGYFANLVASFVMINPIVPGSGTSVSFETATAATANIDDNQNIWKNSSRCTGFVTYHV